MTEQLKNAIKESLHTLETQFNSLTTAQLADRLEAIYEKALIADFIAKLETRKSALAERVARAAEEHIATAKTEPEAEKQKPVTIPETPKKEEPDYSMNPEIKVLPHPEGPPVMRHEEHFSPAEEIEVKAQPPAPAPQPQAPKAQPNPKPASIAERAQQTSKSTSLNDKLAAKKLSFGLNDRIAYVKHLFDGQAEDFTRVVNQLNTYEAWEEAETFINEMVKPDYNWADKAEYEERFLTQIKARFEA